MAWDDGSNKGSQDGPPDLDEMFKKMMGGLKRKKNTSKNAGQPAQASSGGFWPMILGGVAILAIIWVLSGIFVVKAAERGVILRFGKYSRTVRPGVHWIPRLIDSRYVVNVDALRSMDLTELMLTSEENIVSVGFAVQYRIGNLQDYLFNVIDPDKSLRQIVDSAVRQVIGTSKLDDILTTGRESITDRVQKEIQTLVDKYHNGIQIVNVKMQPAKAPEQVKNAFDDVIKAREDNQRLQNEAMSYANKVMPVAEGRAKRILQQANAYKQEVTLQAKGATAQFDALLPKYKMAPKVTAERMYLDAMQHVLDHSKVVLMDTNSNSHNLLYLPVLDQGQQVSQPVMQQQAVQPNKPASNASVQNTMPSVNQQIATRRALARWQEAQNNAN